MNKAAQVAVVDIFLSRFHRFSRSISRCDRRAGTTGDGQRTLLLNSGNGRNGENLVNENECFDQRQNSRFFGGDYVPTKLRKWRSILAPQLSNGFFIYSDNPLRTSSHLAGPGFIIHSPGKFGIQFMARGFIPVTGITRKRCPKQNSARSAVIDLVFLPGVRLTECEVERRRARTHRAWLLRLVTRGMGKGTTKVRKSGGKGRAELWMLSPFLSEKKG